LWDAKKNKEYHNNENDKLYTITEKYWKYSSIQAVIYSHEDSQTKFGVLIIIMSVTMPQTTVTITF